MERMPKAHPTTNGGTPGVTIQIQPRIHPLTTHLNLACNPLDADPCATNAFATNKLASNKTLAAHQLAASRALAAGLQQTSLQQAGRLRPACCKQVTYVLTTCLHPYYRTVCGKRLAASGTSVAVSPPQYTTSHRRGFTL